MHVLPLHVEFLPYGVTRKFPRNTTLIYFLLSQSLFSDKRQRAKGRTLRKITAERQWRESLPKLPEETTQIHATDTDVSIATKWTTTSLPAITKQKNFLVSGRKSPTDNELE